MNVFPQQLDQLPSNHDWYSLGNLKQNLKTLTQNTQGQPIIFYSTCDLARIGEYTKMDACAIQGLDNYLAAMDKYINGIKQFLQLGAQLQNLDFKAQTQPSKQSYTRLDSSQPGQPQSSSNSAQLSSSSYSKFSQPHHQSQKNQASSTGVKPSAKLQNQSKSFGGFKSGFLNK
jgi:hypothetical protein